MFLGLALAAMAAAGKALPGVGDFGRFSGTPAIGLVWVLLIIFVGALGEETGWRGYALPQLQRLFSPPAGPAPGADPLPRCRTSHLGELPVPRPGRKEPIGARKQALHAVTIYFDGRIPTP